MTQDELEDEIWLAMLKQSRAGKGPLFNLQALCTLEGIVASSDDLLNFIKANRGIDGSSDLTTHSAIMFEVSAEGFRRAKSIEARTRPPTLVDRLADEKFQKVGNLSISLLSFVVSIGALAIAALAYLKD